MIRQAETTTAENPVVLIVEDDPSTAELYELIIEKSGVQTVVAHDSITAMEYLHSAQPDALVLDVMMPDESGLDLCRQMRRMPGYAHVPVIMVSALTQREHVRAGMEAGASAYLTKPVSPGVLTETVRQWIVREGLHGQPESALARLESEVQRTIIEVRRNIAEIGRAHRVFEAYSRELRSVQGTPAAPAPAAVRRAVDKYRLRVSQSEGAGWRALEATLRRLEAVEVALRRRGVHEPTRKREWELARARRPFVREDCEQWARSCPEHILTEYTRAVEGGDKIYAYLLERYGQAALEQASEGEHLADLRSMILGAGRTGGDDLEQIERLQERLMPLMAQLSGLRIPDEVVFVQAAAPPTQFNGLEAIFPG